jgi:hypothetical protein
MRTWWIPAAALAVAGGGLLWAWAREESKEVVPQPMAFSHRRHVEEGLSCADCHPFADRKPRASLPTVRQCLLCHSEAKGTHPDEPKVREFAERKQEIPWAQVNRLPGHVYFSHAAHVKYARMDCAECHGDMKTSAEPVTVRQIARLDMAACIACHVQKGVGNDCLRCHK